MSKSDIVSLVARVVKGNQLPIQIRILLMPAKDAAAYSDYMAFLRT